MPFDQDGNWTQGNRPGQSYTQGGPVGGGTAYQGPTFGEAAGSYGQQPQQQPQGPQMPAGIDPALADIYRQGGLTPGERGSGFADWQYWQGVGPSQYDRLRRDIAGTGSDQPTGTPGSGPWQSSGRGQGGGGGAGGGGSLGGFSFGGYNPSSIMTDPNAGNFYNTLMGRVGQSLALNPNDPIIANQVNAFRAEQERGARSAETQEAERVGSAGNLAQSRRGAEERVGQQTGAFQSQLMGRELAARRQEIEQALQEGGQFLTAEQQMKLQEELAQMGSQQRESEFARNLAERGFEFGASVNP